MTARNAALFGVILLGAVLRLVPVVASDFPLNDGALFLTMARDLAANGLVPPGVTSYNDLGSPFAYPPGGFYVLVFLEAAGAKGIDVLRWLPALFSIATIPVAYAIGREVYRGRGMALATAAFFAISTGSYEWPVLGGGITRAPGLLLALLAILFAIRAYRHRGRTASLVAGFALAATGLWHPQAAIFAALSVALVLPFVAADWRRALRSLAVIGITAAVLVLPWLVLVVARHGIDPLLSAVGTGGTPFLGLLSLLTARSSAGYLEVLGIATTFGFAVCMLRREWLPPVWMVAIVVVDSRAGQPYLALPAAMAVAFMVRDLGSVVRRHAVARAWEGVLGSGARRAAPILAAVLVVAAFADSLAAQSDADSPLRAVPESARGAMTWVADNTSEDASFVVVSGRYWAQDVESEWFPVLAERRSLATVQGYEWLGVDRYERQRDRAGELAPCVAAGDLGCVERWLADAGDVDYLFLTRSSVADEAGVDCCLGLADQVATFRLVTTVYQEDRVAIIELAEPVEAIP